ncbi:hypothetical protein THASP1DRAFT_3287, partial [Thamnocephalis sphaerospora]
HYLGLPLIMRRGPIQLLLEDASVAYELHNYSYEKWLGGEKAKYIASGKSPYGVLPVVELEGKSYTHLLPILRHLSRHLGKYTGHTADEEYLVDVYADLINDWFTSFAQFTFIEKGSSEQSTPHFVPKFLQACEYYLSVNEQGPYLLGDELSYGDF